MELSDAMKELIERYPELEGLKDSDVNEYRKEQEYKRWVEQLEEEDRRPKKSSSFSEDNGVQSLSKILDSIDFPGGKIRSSFYKILTEFGLCSALSHGSRAPTEKSIFMGYAQRKEDAQSWYCWNIDMLNLSVPSTDNEKYFSKSRLARFFGWNKVYDVLSPHCLEDGGLTPTTQSLDCGLAKTQYMYEWHFGCIEEISNYFLRINQLMNKDKIQFEEAKNRGEWLGVEGSFPGNEPPMDLLLQLDPDTFERVNSIGYIVN